MQDVVVGLVSRPAPTGRSHGFGARDTAQFVVIEASPLSLSAGRIRDSRAKRALDIVLAGALLFGAAPVMACIALLILLESGGPVLFRQARGGLAGRPFQILKFRSMRPAGANDPVSHASRDDHRVTPLGAFLRRTSLDELPQLFNVLAGDMSLVGPRPHALAHDAFYGECVDGYCVRGMVRPGLTGLAQVSGYRGEIRSLRDMERRVEFDLDYIRTWSIGRDILLIARTAVRAPFDPDAY